MDATSVFFVVGALAHLSMVGCVVASSEAPVPFDAGKTNSTQSTTSKIGLFGGGIVHCQRRLPIWLLSLPQLILNLSGVSIPAKNTSISA
ncbi:TPA: ash family protein [Escherichia coli]|nr:ash family protein [Escherichia coli]